MTELTLPTYADVEAAAARLAGHAHRTPVLRSRTADAALQATLYFNCENLQRMGAFKFRGAFNALSRFSAEQRRAGVLAFSSGNHAQAIALSARELGMPAVIVMPADAPAAKLQATRGYGAEVITYDRYSEDRDAISRRIAAERGMTLIPPFDHADVITGQGTAAKELFDEVGPLDVLLVCLGVAACWPAARWPQGPCRPTAGCTGSSPRPATTASNRCAVARWCTSPRHARLPTAPRPSTWDSSPSASSAAMSVTS